MGSGCEGGERDREIQREESERQRETETERETEERDRYTERKRGRNGPTYTHTHFELWPKVPGTAHSGTAVERMCQETNHCHILTPKIKIPAQSKMDKTGLNQK